MLEFSLYINTDEIYHNDIFPEILEEHGYIEDDMDEQEITPQAKFSLYYNWFFDKVFPLVETRIIGGSENATLTAYTGNNLEKYKIDSHDDLHTVPPHYWEGVDVEMLPIHFTLIGENGIKNMEDVAMDVSFIKLSRDLTQFELIMKNKTGKLVRQGFDGGDFDEGYLSSDNSKDFIVGGRCFPREHLLA